MATRSWGNGIEQTVLAMRARASGNAIGSGFECKAPRLSPCSPSTPPRPSTASVAVLPAGVVETSATAPLWMDQKQEGSSPSRRRIWPASRPRTVPPARTRRRGSREGQGCTRGRGMSSGARSTVSPLSYRSVPRGSDTLAGAVENRWVGPAGSLLGSLAGQIRPVSRSGSGLRPEGEAARSHVGERP
jgi:hypothetical protein